jgi:hypothetical protein
MDVLGKQWRGNPEFLAQATIAPPPTPPVISHDFARQDWGLAIGICLLVGGNLWQMIKGQLTADNNLQNELIKALMEERKMLLASVLERKT